MSETTLCNVSRKWLESMEINPEIHLFIPEIKRVFSLFLCWLFVCLFVFATTMALVLQLFTPGGNRKGNKQTRVLTT